MHFGDYVHCAQLAEKLLFEDDEVVSQMRELITELGPGVFCCSSPLSQLLVCVINILLLAEMSV